MSIPDDQGQNIILLQLTAKVFNLAIFQMYAPTQEYGEEVLKTYNDKLKEVLKYIKSKHILTVMGDTISKKF